MPTAPPYPSGSPGCRGHFRPSLRLVITLPEPALRNCGGKDMKRTLTVVAVCAAFLAGILVSNRLGLVHGQQKKLAGEGFAAVPGLKGGQDVFGPYDPVPNWPKPLAESLPNHEGWTWSQATDIFPESPDRVLVTQKGELPVLPARIKTHWLP